MTYIYPITDPENIMKNEVRENQEISTQLGDELKEAVDKINKPEKVYYIEPHSDSEILKLGIRMALYREPKPKYAFQFQWINESRIAYLKEPEFKVGDVVYYKDDDNNIKYTIKRVTDNYLDIEAAPYSLVRAKAEKLSHYYPGQEVESFRYVREEANCPECNSDLNYSVSTRLWECSQCLQVEGMKELYFSFDVLSRWQEVKEPDEVLIDYSRITGGEVTQELSTNPEYTQFKKGINEAKTLAEIKL